MKLELSKINRAEQAFEFELNGEAADLAAEDLRLVESVAVSGTAAKTSAGIDVRGKLAGAVEMACDRCLRVVTQPVAVDFAVSFVEPEHFSDAAEKELAADELDTDVIRDDFIDLNEVAREQILLSLPVRVLCRADCKGLCESCGTNLNDDDCSCTGETVDPRWSALKSLR